MAPTPQSTRERERRYEDRLAACRQRYLGARTAAEATLAEITAGAAPGLERWERYRNALSAEHAAVAAYIEALHEFTAILHDHTSAGE